MFKACFYFLHYCLSLLFIESSLSHQFPSASMLLSSLFLQTFHCSSTVSIMNSSSSLLSLNAGCHLLLCPNSISTGSYYLIFGRGVQTFGISGPHWKKKSCLGPHIKYITLTKTKKSHNVLSKFMILC